MGRQRFKSKKVTSRKTAEASARTSAKLQHDKMIETWRRKFPLLARFIKKLPTPNRPAMRTAGRELGIVYQEIMGSNDAAKIWYHLERVHILTQEAAFAHTTTHILMFFYALYRRDWKESLGQISRMLLAAPSTFFGLAPPGNTGRTTMRLSEKGPIPGDLRSLLLKD